MMVYVHTHYTFAPRHSRSDGGAVMGSEQCERATYVCGASRGVLAPWQDGGLKPSTETKLKDLPLCPGSSVLLSISVGWLSPQ